jgi:hypothetical protein
MPILIGMRRISRLVGGALLAVALALPEAAPQSSHDFQGHKFTIQLPAGYAFQADASPQPMLKTFGFSTDPRSDGTRGMIQVSLMDLSVVPAGEALPTLDKVAAAMIKGVSQRRSRWEQSESSVKIAGVAGTRFEWAGSTEPGFGRPPVHMRGVMIVGIKKTVAFTLHTQDVVAFAETTLPLCEQALNTFALTVRR